MKASLSNTEFTQFLNSTILDINGRQYKATSTVDPSDLEKIQKELDSNSPADHASAMDKAWKLFSVPQNVYNDLKVSHPASQSIFSLLLNLDRLSSTSETSGRSSR